MSRCSPNRSELLNEPVPCLPRRGWPDWYLCSAPGHEPGYAPGQILDRHTDGSGTMLEDFTNRELNVVEGEELRGEHRSGVSWEGCMGAPWLHGRLW